MQSLHSPLRNLEYRLMDRLHDGKAMFLGEFPRHVIVGVFRVFRVVRHGRFRPGDVSGTALAAGQSLNTRGLAPCGSRCCVRERHGASRRSVTLISKDRAACAAPLQVHTRYSAAG